MALEIESTIMATTPQTQGFGKHWTLINFARTHGKMSVGTFTNKQTGEQFKSCVFTDSETAEPTFCAFSSNLGEKTPAEISAMKNELQVVEMKESGNFILCKRGNNAWEDVDLGI